MINGGQPSEIFEQALRDIADQIGPVQAPHTGDVWATRIKDSLYLSMEKSTQSSRRSQAYPMIEYGPLTARHLVKFSGALMLTQTTIVYANIF